MGVQSPSGHELHHLRHLFDQHSKHKKSKSGAVPHSFGDDIPTGKVACSNLQGRNRHLQIDILETMGDDITTGKEKSFRLKVLDVLDSHKFEILIGVLVLLDLIATVIEVAIISTVPCEKIEKVCSESIRVSATCRTMERARCYSEGLDEFCNEHAVRSCDTAEYVNDISFAFLLFFILDMATRFICCPERFVTDFGRMLDLAITLIALMVEILEKRSHPGDFVILLRSWRIVEILHAFFEQYNTIIKQESLVRESEDALGFTFNFLDDRGLHDEFHNFCHCGPALTREEKETAI